jgi:hypothetical protein
MKNPKFTVVHRVDENNVGDMASNPLQYFLKPSEYQTVDIVDLYKTQYVSKTPLIVGGGGLLENEFFGDAVRNVLSSADKGQLLNLWEQRWELCDPSNKDTHDRFLSTYHSLLKETIDSLDSSAAPRFIWGAGHNGEVTKKNRNKFEYSDWLAEFDQVGIRDWGQDLNWVPCASCMHPALRKTYSIKNDVIWFEHKKQLIKDFGNDVIPRFVNSGDNVEQTIELLGSANIILTNSYHGAYWGTLLKKKVIVVSAWSSKFYAMKHMPRILEKGETWKEVVDDITIDQDALDECAVATETYWNTIKGYSN